MTPSRTQPKPHFASSPRHLVTTAVLVAIFWLPAAILVVGAHAALDAQSAAGSETAALAGLGVIAYGYTRLVARESGVAHGIGVGIAWLLLSIVAELALRKTAQGAVDLLGSPSRPFLRDICVLGWIFAPSLFVRRRSEDGGTDR
ncbi:MAG: hypothetical protein WBX15_13250 [Thermoanaerobaculia bacterium]